MNRKEAEKLLGSHVSVWTAANGDYVGTLIEVLPARPWRGKVRITGVLQPAVAFEYGRSRPRRGFRPGEMIEVGGVNIKPTEEQGVSYLEALIGQRDLTKARLDAGAVGPKDIHVQQKILEALNELVEAERRREQEEAPPVTPSEETLGPIHPAGRVLAILGPAETARLAADLHNGSFFDDGHLGADWPEGHPDVLARVRWSLQELPVEALVPPEDYPALLEWLADEEHPFRKRFEPYDEPLVVASFGDIGLSMAIHPWVLIDGWHRFAALVRAGATHVRAYVGQWPDDEDDPTVGTRSADKYHDLEWHLHHPRRRVVSVPVPPAGGCPPVPADQRLTPEALFARWSAAPFVQLEGVMRAFDLARAAVPDDAWRVPVNARRPHRLPVRLTAWPAVWHPRAKPWEPTTELGSDQDAAFVWLHQLARAVDRRDREFMRHADRSELLRDMMDRVYSIDGPLAHESLGPLPRFVDEEFPTEEYPPWDLFDAEGLFEIQRVDEVGYFDNDSEAEAHVVRLAEIGVPYAVWAEQHMNTPVAWTPDDPLTYFGVRPNRPFWRLILIALEHAYSVYSTLFGEAVARDVPVELGQIVRAIAAAVSVESGWPAPVFLAMWENEFRCRFSLGESPGSPAGVVGTSPAGAYDEIFHHLTSPRRTVFDPTRTDCRELEPDPHPAASFPSQTMGDDLDALLTELPHAARVLCALIAVQMAYPAWRDDPLVAERVPVFQHNGPQRVATFVERWLNTLPESRQNAWTPSDDHMWSYTIPDIMDVLRGDPDDDSDLSPGYHYAAALNALLMAVAFDGNSRSASNAQAVVAYAGLAATSEARRPAVALHSFFLEWWRQCRCRLPFAGIRAPWAAEGGTPSAHPLAM